VWPNGQRSVDTVYAVKTPAGWKIITISATADQTIGIKGEDAEMNATIQHGQDTLEGFLV
jgi:hypothetical protein